MPIRIQRKRTKGWRMPENTIYVGRGSRWGNPFVVGIDGDRQECIDKYEKMLFPYTHRDGDLHDFFLSNVNYEDIIDNLKGKNLACWCKISESCHADVLLEIANPKEQSNAK